MAMPSGQANAVNALLCWLLNLPGGNGVVPDAAQARADAMLLADRAYKSLHAGLTADEVAKEWDARMRADASPYVRVAEACRDLGKVVDVMAEVMRQAVTAARDDDPEAGMAVILDYFSEVPELAEGLDLPEAVTG